MDPGEDPDLALNIPVRAIFEEFCCPICFSPIEECMITPCGHNFCSGCIKECLNLKHSCPCCNKETLAAQLVRNRHFDKLIEIVIQEKDKASKNYFERLINKPNMPDMTASQEISVQSGFSPIEKIFHKHMKRSLMNYEEYYQEIYGKFQAQCKTISSSYTETLSANSAKLERKTRRIARGASDRSLEQTKARYEGKSQKLQAECNSKLAELEESFNESVRLLLDVYDKYLEGFAPAKEFLPVVITIRVLGKDATIPNVSISRTDCIKDLKVVIERRLAETGNPVESWGKNCAFVLKNPFAGDDATVITDENLPIVQYGAQQGTELVVKGGLLLESDKPKVCFTATFKKGAMTNYYSCKDCNINWVCSECAEVCHSGHKIVDYLKDHKPTWNCCYCVKKKKCKLPNKTTQAKK
mmetsp:Transcript_133774/g.198926  ORF Transcript_133774/g.198926 Transcript_133774/m.198926 type:complete len:413 (+) Transcript_133774:32-1270(+)